MKLKKYYINLIVLLFLFVTSGYSQNSNKNKLKGRVDENKALFFTNPDKAFLNTESLLEEAISMDDFDIELSLLEHRCWYYYQRSDADNLLRTARILFEKSKKYQRPLWEANAHNYLSAGYEINQLYDKSIEEFNKSIIILEKENDYDADIISAKTNAYFSLAKIYLIQDQPEKAKPYLILITKENEKLRDSIRKRRSLYMNYANLAACYLKIDSDSSEYYAKQSILFKPEDAAENDPITFLNYSVLGDIKLGEKKYKEALFYYNQSEKILSLNKGNLGNQKELFRGFYETYQGLGDTIKSKIYWLKFKEVELEISQNRNKSLVKIVQETSKEKSNNLLIITLSILFIIVVLTLVFYLRKKSKLLEKQEKISQEYLNNTPNDLIPNNDNNTIYTTLVEMVKNNESSFLAVFLDKFPDFSSKLEIINPKIVQTEIEFCALLKLNIPTKEIAKYKNIEPRTVQNKKYLVRKKLDIPKDLDIYLWFSKL